MPLPFKEQMNKQAGYTFTSTGSRAHPLPFRKRACQYPFPFATVWSETCLCFIISWFFCERDLTTDCPHLQRFQLRTFKNFLEWCECSRHSVNTHWEFWMWRFPRLAVCDVITLWKAGLQHARPPREPATQNPQCAVCRPTLETAFSELHELFIQHFYYKIGFVLDEFAQR